MERCPWVAVTGSLAWQPFILAMGVLFWVAGFDILYSCMDINFDREEGLKSIPTFFGSDKGLRIARLFHVFAWILFLITGFITGIGWPYFTMVMVVGILLIIEHRLISPHDFTHLNAAFFTVNSVISIVYFFGVFLAKVI